MTSGRPIQPASAAGGAYGLRPQDLHTAYQLPTSAVSAQTVAIVDAYNDPQAEADLTVYDKEFLLPECTSGNGCFRQVNQNGEAGNLPFPKSQEALAAREATCANKAIGKKAREAACTEVEEAKGWRGEISLDIEVAHAICQNCHIVLVEASSPSYEDLEAADNTAASLGATEISNSWGGGEPEQDSPAFNHPGIVITASSGDAGYLNWNAANSFEKGFPEYPASSPNVVAVGGTRLTLNSPVHTWQSEAVWNGYGAGGGGCSLEFNPQAWQPNVADWTSVGCGERRAVADVSADADPYTGVAVYDSQRSEAWNAIGGTSVASPLIASVFALAGGANGVSYPAQTLYQNEIKSPGSLHDIVSGSNGECTKPFNGQGISGCSSGEESASCSSQAICLAGLGYDGPTGVGTPQGIAAFQPPEGGGTTGGSTSTPAGGTSTPPGGTGTPPGSTSTPGASTSTTGTTTTTGQSGGSASGASRASSSATPAKPLPTLSGLSLTRGSILALNSVRPRVSQVRFAFTLSGPARVRVRVTLAKLIRARGHTRWRVLPASLTIAANVGRNSHRLGARNALAPGRYRLTLTPAHGAARSIVFQIG